jgi:hypothetical protein
MPRKKGEKNKPEKAQKKKLVATKKKSKISKVLC